MLAAVYKKFGAPEVVKIEKVKTPRPKDHEVLIKVHASTVSVADHRLRSKTLPKGFKTLASILSVGVLKPRKMILGMDIAGVIVATGKNVSKFKIGDQVVALTDNNLGAHAEYKCMDENGIIALKPDTLNFEESVALLFGGLTVVRCLNDITIQPGCEVLINGASGSVGTQAVQIVKSFGATVTAVCSGENTDLVKSLGADFVIDYKREDFTSSNKQYDIIFDCVGNAPFEKVEHNIKQGGRLLLVITDLKGMIFASGKGKKLDKKVVPLGFNSSLKELEVLLDLQKRGKCKAVIDRIYNFKNIVAAHKYVDTGRKKGNVVILMD